MSTVVAATFVGAMAVLGPGAHAADQPRVFEYLYVEANSGGASGGHAAVRFGEACYHFQQGEQGTIRLYKESFERFDFSYRALGNRTIHASRIGVAPTTYDRLRDTFERELQVQRRQFEELDDLRNDRILLARLVASAATGRPSSIADDDVRVPGSAYFVPGQAAGSVLPLATDGPRSVELEGLAHRVREAYGAVFLERRGTELRAAIADLRPDKNDAPVALPEAGRMPTAPAGFAVRYRELLGNLLAIEVLRAALPLRPESVVLPAEPEFQLGSAEVAQLHRFAAGLREVLVRLLASRRPDWGYPLLIGMARLEAIEASIASQRLVLLGTLPADAAVIAAEQVGHHAATLTAVLGERRADFLRAREQFFETEEPGEARLSRVEATANLLAEMRRALEQHTAMRVPSDSLAPAGAVTRSEWPEPELPQGDTQTGLELTRRREAAYAAALQRLYRYDVVRRNCVTELFRTIAAALRQAADDGEGGEHARLIALAVEFDAGTTLNFIPFVSAAAVRETYPVVETVERPSYRRLELGRMAAREGPLAVELRESNVLTARSYERNEADPIFLFFTDEAGVGRPVLGAANLVVGLGAGVVGLAMAPFDRGRTLRAGVDGALLSLPELAFINIRKGSYAFALRAWMEADHTP